MSDPTETTQANPHPVSGHRTPREIAKDEAGPIGQADADVVAGGAPGLKPPGTGDTGGEFVLPGGTTSGPGNVYLTEIPASSITPAIGASSPRPANGTKENVMSKASSHSPTHLGGN